MIKWLKRNQGLSASEVEKNSNTSAENSIEITSKDPIESVEPVQQAFTKEGIFARFRRGLSKTRHQLGDGISRLLLGKKEMSKDLLEELETLLISADLGIDTTQTVLKQLEEGLDRKELSDGDSVHAALKLQLRTLLEQSAHSLSLETADKSPF